MKCPIHGDQCPGDDGGFLIDGNHPDDMFGVQKEEKMPQGEFSVCQFFPTGDYEYVRRFVNAEEAVKAFKHYTTSVGARMGTTVRVILTDGGDCVNWEWEYGKGIVFPTKADLEQMEKEQ